MKISYKLYGHCTMIVEGTNMRCPLCNTLVLSGQRHECERKEPKKLERKAGRRVKE